MKGCGFVRLIDSVLSKLHLSAGEMIFRIFGVLFLLTMMSLWLVCGMLARFTSSEDKNEVARVAAAGQVDIFENEAYFDDETYSYQLRDDSIVSRNTYPVIVPGMEIEKDPFIRLYGNNEVSYYLYLEVRASDRVRYELSSVWSVTNDIAASHGGTVYKFQSVIKPGEKRDIREILKDHTVRIRDDLKDKSQPSANSDPFTMDFYAYMIQAD